MLLFIVSDISNFDNLGISTDNERKSVDQLKTIKHIEHITDEQLNIIRFDDKFDFLSNDNFYNLMNTEEWKDEEV